jgi:DNA-binding LacI/PurR family transcriptional regulator
VLRGKPDGVFCCNDRLAEAMIRHCLQGTAPRPAIIGFDDAPIAAALHLNTIAIPWSELVGAAVKMISLRMSGDRSAAIRQVVAPLPIQR